MKIWIASEFYFPEENATGYLMTKLAEGLAEKYSVGVLCAFPADPSLRPQAPRTEVRNGVTIRRCTSTHFSKDVLAYRLINVLTICIGILSSMLRVARRHDRILVVTNPPLLPFIAWIAARTVKASCLMLVHDVYPEVLVAAGVASRGSWMVSVLDSIHRSLYRDMERIVVLGRDMRDLVSRKIPSGDNRLVLIPNGADVKVLAPLPKTGNLILGNLRLQDKFVVEYVGNMGRTHGIEDLFASAVALAGNTDIHFLFVGTGAKRKWLQEAVTRSGIGNLTLLPYPSREEQAVVHNACDVAIISLKGGMAGISVPSRLYNVMAAGKPIIAVVERGSELAMVVEEERIGWLVPPENPGKIVAAIKDAYDQKSKRRAMGKRARTIAVQKYSLQRTIKAYQALFPKPEGKD